MESRAYTKQQIKFISEKYSELSVAELCEKTSLREGQVRNILYNYAGIRPREMGSLSKKWSEKEIEILADENLTDYQKAKRLPNRTDSSVRIKRARMGFKSKPVIFNREYHSQGYKHIRKNGGYKREHQFICEQHLGRKLEKWEVVHHINGVKLANNIENLFVCSRKQHNKAHNSCFGLVVSLMERGLAYFDRKEGVYKLTDF